MEHRNSKFRYLVSRRMVAGVVACRRSLTAADSASLLGDRPGAGDDTSLRHESQVGTPLLVYTCWKTARRLRQRTCYLVAAFTIDYEYMRLRISPERARRMSICGVLQLRSASLAVSGTAALHRSRHFTHAKSHFSATTSHISL